MYEGDWHFYHAEIDGVDSLVFVRTDLYEAAPDTTRPWLLKLMLSVKSRRADGQTEKAETEALWNVEDCLENSIREQWSGVYVGRHTGAGRRTLFYFMPKEPDTAIAQALVRTCVGDYSFEIDGWHDDEWENFLKFLYPNEIGWMEITNKPVLDRLEEQGDHLEPERHTLHWLYFTSKKQRDGFMKALKSAKTKFDVVAPINPEKKGEQHGVRLEHQCSMLWGRILHVQIELLRLAQEFNGEYDGFECQLVKDS